MSSTSCRSRSLWSIHRFLSASACLTFWTPRFIAASGSLAVMRCASRCWRRSSSFPQTSVVVLLISWLTSAADDRYHGSPARGWRPAASTNRIPSSTRSLPFFSFCRCSGSLKRSIWPLRSNIGRPVEAGSLCKPCPSPSCFDVERSLSPYGLVCLRLLEGRVSSLVSGVRSFSSIATLCPRSRSRRLFESSALRERSSSATLARASASSRRTRAMFSEL
jgi:hypothetical protein